MKRHILLSILTVLCCTFHASTTEAQERAVPNIRYVAKSGKYNNTGLSWAQAKNNIQDAINDLVDKNQLPGEVWVARGVYTPTESTESSGGSTLYMSFKVPAGITIRGGFFGPGEVPGKTVADSLKYFKQLMGKTYIDVLAANGQTVTLEKINSGDWFPGEDRADQRARYATSHDYASNDTVYPYFTTLSGDLSQTARIEWNKTKKYWDISYYGNCYHVVWFATNGFDADGRARALDPSKGDACVEGFHIVNGNAQNKDLLARHHNAYGGGAYMVEGSRLENCHISQCEASRDGGGVYMDGGGVVKHCYVTNCQALGTSVENGYGGGVCLDANKNVATSRFGMYRSVINGCVARYGGGVAIKSEDAKAPDGTDLRYKTFVSATAVYNNTASTEGGGVYMLNGGAITNMTITRNQCNGTGIISRGMATGRAGGLYCRDHCVVMNSVIWGNECRANNDIQFASSQSKAHPDLKVEMYYCALALANQTDWSSTAKEGIFQVSRYNSVDDLPAGTSPSETDRFVNFVNPTNTAGYVDKEYSDDPTTTSTPTQIGLYRFYNWQPGPNSVLANAGIVSNDLNTDGDLPFTDIPADVLGLKYNSRSTLGAYTRKFGRMTPIRADMFPDIDNPETTDPREWHFFVDPNFNTQHRQTTHGVSWDIPARYLANVLHTIKYLQEKYDEDTYKPDATEAADIQFHPSDKIYVHIKEGTVDNTNSYTNDRVRNVSLSIPSNVTILGGYPEQLGDTQLSATIGGTLYQRNPVWHPTFVNGNITQDYEMNASHIFTINGTDDKPAHNVTIDGLNIRNANARSTMHGNTIVDGGGISINAAENITIRNCIIAGCTAVRGPALFVKNGRNVTVENCIFHNNESKNLSSGAFSGVAFIESFIDEECHTTFKHCNVMNNVGYAFIVLGKAKMTFENSIAFANMNAPRSAAYYTADDSDTEKTAFRTSVLPSWPAAGYIDGSITMSNSLYDPMTVVNGTPGTLIYELNNPMYPRFVNGVKNVGISRGGDETFYGRGTSFEPHNENPMVNAATYSGAHDTWGTDMTTVTTRDYGGLPDIGAMENHAATAGDGNENAYADGQPAYGSVLYVKTAADGGSDTNDGSSWAKAFATVQVAIEIAAHTTVDATGKHPEVWVAEGEYVFSSDKRDTENTFGKGTGQYYLNALYLNRGWNDTRPWDNAMEIFRQKFSICMREGVNVTGGFPKTGYPGMGEREPKIYETRIAPSATNAATNAANKNTSVGRAMVQATNFSEKTTLDGVTLTNGYLFSCYQYNIAGDISKIYDDETHSRQVGQCGGCGAYVLANCILENCKISGNYSFFQPLHTNSQIISGSANGGFHQSAAGVFLNGGELRNCNITNNVMQHALTRNSSGTIESAWMYGAGLYMNNGTVYNTIIANNTAEIVDGYNHQNKRTLTKETRSAFHEVVVGAGALIVNGNFFNNTITQNTSRTYNCDQRNVSISGVYVNSSATIYNSIIANNPFNHQGTGGTVVPGSYQVCFMDNNYAPNSSGVTVRYSYVGVNIDTDNNASNFTPYEVVNDNSEGTNFYNDSPLNLTTSTINGISYEYSLGSGSKCINNGSPEVINSNDETILVENVTAYDAAYTDRVKDCTVDIGAYEYEDFYAITPKTIKKDDGTVDETKAATFYVTPKGRRLASGDSPENAACADKLQRILDAAGRYKFTHPNQQIIVKVAYSSSLKNNATNPTDFKYYATRTTDKDDADVRVYSIIVPRGVEVWGGYSDTFTDENNNGFYKNTVNNNGVVTNTEEQRDILKNPTYFDSYYYSDDLASGINTYHVVTFTDKLFDSNGNPYLDTEVSRIINGQDSQTSSGSSASNYLRVNNTFTYNGQNYGGVEDRAVIDGIHITGGQADLKSYSTGANTVNVNQYGGAAIVTDYAHVRNCIVRGNSGTYGGALALTGNALVSGCLIDGNEAEYGGAIYVFEDGTRLSDGTLVITNNNNNYKAESLEYIHRYDYNMARIYSSTIVNNNATKQGGGVWYGVDDPNVRFNSSVLWQNQSQDQPNVSGVYNITRSDGQTYHTTEYYPFNYCAIQDIQASGLNNMPLMPENANGTRFHDEGSDPDRTNLDLIAAEKSTGDRYADFGNYGLSNHSILLGAGMPVTEWENIRKDPSRNYGLSDRDFTNTERKVVNSGAQRRANIEIGARALAKAMYDDQLMLRLFVAKVEDTDINAINAMIAARKQAETESNQAKRELMLYYSQKGSSFAYPFNTLQEALDYIYYQRGFVDGTTIDVNCKGLTKYHANNMPFEIYMGAGEFFPTADITNTHSDHYGYTFLIPEGVNIIGGFKPSAATNAKGELRSNNGSELHFFGKHMDPDYKDPKKDEGQTLWDQGKYYVESNKKAITETVNDKEVKIDSIIIKHLNREYVLHHVQKDTAAMVRTLSDNNANSIVEPWEFEQQTILSGHIEGKSNNGVHHVITIMANQAYSGALPSTQGVKYTAATGTDVGYKPHEYGQIIALDGLTVTGGYAYNYLPNTISEQYKFGYSMGGAIMMDTNQYWDLYNKSKDKGGDGESTTDVETNLQTPTYMHLDYMGAVGYRDIPLMINRCRFNNNHAGYGGAISTNTTLDVINSSFEQNRAVSGKDTVDMILPNGSGGTRAAELHPIYPGVGGAIYGTYQVTGVNTIFENNEAYDAVNSHDLQDYYLLNECVRAEVKGSNLVPRQLLGGSGGAVFMARKGYFHFLNCNFVRNAANAFPCIYTLNPNKTAIESLDPGNPVLSRSLKNYNQVLNTVFWGNDIHEEVKNKHKNDDNYNTYSFIINKVVNYGKADRIYTHQPSLKDGDAPKTQKELDKETKYTEQVWFSAYEEGRGKTPVNNIDLRDMEFYPRQVISDIIKAKITALRDGGMAIDEEFTYQNCNILLASENAVNEGPNFVNPSVKAGYNGYMQSADWSPARLNNLTDYGWGKILQDIELIGTEYITRFVKYGDKYGPNDEYKAEIPNERDTVNIEERDGYFATYGAYPAIRNLMGNEKYLKTIPLGDQPYMYTTYTDKEGKIVPLYRISYDPSPTHNQTYVDVGVYEYHHTQLEYTTEGDEVDVIWVSSLEKPDNGLPDGSAWSQPTSDLQRAIETLLSSRNGHRKEIRMMEGVFKPTYIMNNKLTFYIDTEYQNTSTLLELDSTKTTATDKKKYNLGVMSLTIKGGYSYEQEGKRDVDECPVVIQQMERTDGNDDNKRWDHLFYIKDPTQRYGKEKYEESNNFGNYKTENSTDGSHKEINTIPIQFEGVTLINDNASAGTKGAVIHYADLDGAATDSVNGEHFDKDQKIEASPAHVTTRFASAADHDWDTIPKPAKIIIARTKIIGSGAHNQNSGSRPTSASAVYLGNNGGHALIYNTVFHSNYGDPLVGKCEVRSVNNTFARNIGKVDLSYDGAANSLIYNSVLWNNNKTENGYGEQFDIIGATETTDGKFDVKNNAAIFQYNAFTGGNTDSEDYSVNGFIAANHFNVGITEDNDNIIKSPRFTKPEAAVTERDFSIQPSLRLMHKGNTALYDTITVKQGEHSYVDDYGNKLKKKEAGHVEEDSIGVMMKMVNDNPMIYDLAYEPSVSIDAANLPRKVNEIDLGAYEYQNTLNRVLYVDPNKTSNDPKTTDAKTWETANGLSKLQDAVDLAALYHIVNNSEQAYVFVRGASATNKNLHTGEALTIRNGVSVYGGIHPLFKEECESTTETDGVITYTDEQLSSYIAAVKNSNEGHVGGGTYATRVLGIRTNAQTTFNTANNDIYSLVDGFHVTAKTDDNADGKVTETVISVDPQFTADANDATKLPKVALRNIIVYDNDLSAAYDSNGTGADKQNIGKDIAYIKNALIYSALFRNNETDELNGGAVLKLKDNAWAVSITAEGKVVGASDDESNNIMLNGGGTTDNEKNQHILNSLVNFRGQDPKDAGDKTRKTLSGWNYRRAASDFESKDREPNRDLYYQLVEGSKHINQIEITKSELYKEDGTVNAAKPYLPAEMGSLKMFIDYTADRDLLGNRRLLTLTDKDNNGTSLAEGNELLDRGAFETWYVDQDTWTTEENHFTPHQGSVVYVMEGRSLVCGTDIKPGFLLIKDGASLYGNGNNVDVAFISVERKIQKNGSVVSMPFPMLYKPQIGHTDDVEGTDIGYCIPKYDNGGILSLDCPEGSNERAQIKTYSGTNRSDFKHVFAKENSGMWEGYDENDTIPANTGVLFKPVGITKDEIYAFTAQGVTMGAYIYKEESDETFKNVVLKQYDDYTSSNGKGDFTSKENMGWNCIGLPYLVSEYRTYDNDYVKKALNVDETVLYNMQTPKTLWLYYNGKTPDNIGTVDGDGGYFSVKSWEFTNNGDGTNSWHLPSEFGDARIWIGEGIFTQTAAVGTEEALTFYRPIAPTQQTVTPGTGEGNGGAQTAPRRTNTRYYAGEESIEDRMELNLTIRVRQRTVSISGLKGGEHVAIYDAAGRLYASGTASKAPEDSVIGTQYSTTLPATGVYIIAVDGTRKKVAVR